MLDYLIKDFKTKKVQSLNDISLHFRRADTADVDVIVALVESVYRGEGSKRGWTTEADILGGQRTDRDMIKNLMNDGDCLFLLCVDKGIVIASVLLERKVHYAYLGMLAVDVNYQNLKLGRRMIQVAEKWVREQWQMKEMRMSVIDVRPELIAWYERRGYQRTGDHQDFPSDVRFGIPKVPVLRLAELAKDISSAEDEVDGADQTKSRP